MSLDVQANLEKEICDIIADIAADEVSNCIIVKKEPEIQIFDIKYQVDEADTGASSQGFEKKVFSKESLPVKSEEEMLELAAVIEDDVAFQEAVYVLRAKYVKEMGFKTVRKNVYTAIFKTIFDHKCQLKFSFTDTNEFEGIKIPKIILDLAIHASLEDSDEIDENLFKSIKANLEEDTHRYTVLLRSCCKINNKPK